MSKLVNQITNGDCMDVMSRIPDNGVHLILTDIPYDVVNRPSQGLRILDKKDADIATFDLVLFCKEIVRVCSGSVYVFCSTEQVSLLRKTLVELGLTTRLCIWEKTNPSPMNGQHLWLSGVETCVYGKKPKATFNEHCKNTVWRYPSVRGKRHPTEKNHALFGYLIETSSNAENIVLDPCNGSGVTTMMAKKLGRRFIGIDISDEYCQIAKDRINSIST